MSSSAIKQGRGAAGMLLRDDALAQRIRQTINATGSNVQEIVTDLKAGRGSAGMLLRDEALAAQIRETVKNGRASDRGPRSCGAKADSLVTDLNSRQIPQKQASCWIASITAQRQLNRTHCRRSSKPDDEGMSAGANIRASLTNANAATANLADATEALKHNFLLRGFFNKRGYYSLADLSPEHVSPR